MTFTFASASVSFSLSRPLRPQPGTPVDDGGWGRGGEGEEKEGEGLEQHCRPRCWLQSNSRRSAHWWQHLRDSLHEWDVPGAQQVVLTVDFFSRKSTDCLVLGKAWFIDCLNMTLLLQVCSPGLFTLSYSLILPHGSLSSVYCHLYAFQNAPTNLIPCMIPAEEAVFKGKETPDQTQDWQGCPSYLSLTCIYPVGFQCRAAAAGLCGDAACPWWKAEEEARGDAEATEGVRGGWGRGLWRRWGRSQGGATGGLGWGPWWCVAICESPVQTTTTPQNSLLQSNYHHQ